MINFILKVCHRIWNHPFVAKHQLMKIWNADWFWFNKSSFVFVFVIVPLGIVGVVYKSLAISRTIDAYIRGLSRKELLERVVFGFISVGFLVLLWPAAAYCASWIKELVPSLPMITLTCACLLLLTAFLTAVVVLLGKFGRINVKQARD